MAIDTAERIHLRFDIRCFGGASYQLKVNGRLVNSNSATLGLLDPIDIQIEKKGTGLVDVSNITINDFQVMPMYLIHADPPTNRLESDNTWRFRIAPNYYVWYHHIMGNGWIA
jgi:hypothetical protein